LEKVDQGESLCLGVRTVYDAMIHLEASSVLFEWLGETSQLGDNVSLGKAGCC
jgi:hypothetical protein